MVHCQLYCILTPVQVRPLLCHPHYSNISLLLSGCRARYSVDYFVDQNAHTRTYYGGMPDTIHVSTHMVLEASLCRRFVTSSACAWCVVIELLDM